MSKTTPGPWLAERSAGTLIMQVVAPSAPRSKRVVARLGGADVRDGNARLIAAAPDMLDTERRLAAEVGGLRAFEHEIRAAIGNTNWTLLMQRLAEADAAIAKAEGK